MSTNLKPILLGLGLAAGIAFGAPAQTVAVTPGPSVANLPPEGPRVSSNNFIPAPAQLAIAPSGTYPGPAAGAGTGVMPPHFVKPAGYDQNAALHPYTSGFGPRPN